MLDLICRVCGEGKASLAFSGTVLGDVPADYVQCGSCRSLFVLYPTWLDRAYSSQAYIDYMKMCETDTTLQNWQTTFGWPVIQHVLPEKPCRAIDWGPGSGWFIENLLRDGHDACGFERYDWKGMVSSRAAERIVRDLDDAPGPFEVASAIEVLEHAPYPGSILEHIASRLTDPGVVIVSTGIYNDDGPDWFYLAQAYGQHITFLSANGFRRCAEKVGLRWECTVTGSSAAEINYPIHILSKGEFDRTKLDGTKWSVVWK